MRFVVYDDDTVEPITVVNLPGVAERDILERGERWRVPVPQDMEPAVVTDCESAPSPARLPYVELRFERFMRRGQITLMCFTREAELALLLDPDFLPGQRREISRIREEADAVTSLFVRLLAPR